MYKIKKQIYISLMIISFIILNANNIYATTVAVPTDIPILPFTPTGIPTGSDSTLIKALSGDPEAIATVWNDFQTFKNGLEETQEANALLTSVKVASFINNLSQKFNGSNETITSPVDDVSDIAKSDIIKSIVASDISTNNELNRHLKGELSEQDKESINEINANLTYDSTSNTYTVGDNTSENVFDVIDGLSDSAKTYFLNYQSQVLYNVSRSALASSVLDKSLSVGNSAILDFDYMLSKYHRAFTQNRDQYVRFCVKVVDKHNPNNELIKITAFKNRLLINTWDDLYYEYYNAKIYPTIVFDGVQVKLGCYMKYLQNGEYVWFRNQVDYFLSNDDWTYIYKPTGEFVGTEQAYINLNDFEIKEISVGGYPHLNNDFSVYLQKGFYVKKDSNNLRRMTNDEVLNLIQVANATDVLNHDFSNKKRPVVIPDINLENSKVISTDIPLDNLDISLDKAKDNVATLNPDTLNPTYNYTTNVTNNITNNTIIADGFITSLISAIDMFLKNMFTINYSAIKQPFETFLNLVFNKIPFINIVVNFANQINVRMQEFDTNPVKPVIKIKLPSFGGGGEVVFTDLKVFDEYRDTFHNWIILVGWLYVVFNITKRLPLILAS